MNRPLIERLTIELINEIDSLDRRMTYAANSSNHQAVIDYQNMKDKAFKQLKNLWIEKENK